MFDPRFPPTRGTRRLFGRLQAKLPPDEEVLAVVALMRGPRPGSEVYWPMVGALVDLSVGLLVAFGVSKATRSSRSTASGYWISGFGDQVYRLRRVMAAHGSRHRTEC
jgi:hypothetical protein